MKCLYVQFEEVIPRRGSENASISLQCIDHIRIDPVTTFLINLVMSSLNVMFHRSGQQNIRNTMPTTCESRQHISMWVCKKVPCGLAVAYIMLTSQIHSGLYYLNGAFLEHMKVFNLPTFLQNSGVNKTPQYADFGVE
jgi:hypothetical protein